MTPVTKFSKDELREYIATAKFIEFLAGGTFTKSSIPTRWWMATPTVRCLNDHVANQYEYVKPFTGGAHGCCILCGTSVFWTFPEDYTSGLAHYFQNRMGLHEMEILSL